MRYLILVACLGAMAVSCYVEEGTPAGEAKKDWAGLTKHKQVCHYEVELEEVKFTEISETSATGKKTGRSYKANVEVQTQGSDPGDGVTVTIISGEMCAEYSGKLDTEGIFWSGAIGFDRATGIVGAELVFAGEMLTFDWSTQGLHMTLGDFDDEALRGYCESGSQDEPASMYDGSSPPCEKYRLNYKENGWEKEQEDGSWKRVEHSAEADSGEDADQ